MSLRAMSLRPMLQCAMIPARGVRLVHNPLPESRKHRSRASTILPAVGLVTVPLSYADQLYALRSHIQLVRERLENQDNPR
jgi:hypothetical protein